MNQKQLSPAAWADADRARKIVCLAAAIAPEDSRSTLINQRLQAISRRVSLSSTVAAVVAELAFGEARP